MKRGLVGRGALQCRVCSPQPLSAEPRASAGEETGYGSWIQRGLDAEEWQERSRVVHSDPAATIKIGGVRCLHSSLCKSHQPEPCLFLAAGYIIMRSAGGLKWVMSCMANMRCRSCFLISQLQCASTNARAGALNVFHMLVNRQGCRSALQRRDGTGMFQRPRVVGTRWAPREPLFPWFCSSLLRLVLPTGLPSLYLFSCFKTDCLLPSQRHLVLID